MGAIMAALGPAIRCARCAVVVECPAFGIWRGYRRPAILGTTLPLDRGQFFSQRVGGELRQR